MQLPPRLRNAIEQEISSRSLSLLVKAASELSEKYRTRRRPVERFITTDVERLAYAAVRMPATFAAARNVFAEIRRLTPQIEINNLLDLGAGTGAAAWAAVDVFGEIEQVTMIEQDQGLIELGQKLALASEHAALCSAEWRRLDLTRAPSFADHDLVVCSYSLGEIESGKARGILKAAWQAARQVIAVIQPGTMKGFELIRALRDELVVEGGYLIAPCPHHRACPMAENDWCHFSARFDRSSLHRRIKGAELGYEDEKYSYIAASKSPVQPASARVIRHPLRGAGFTQLQLCAKEGLASVTVTRKDKEAWKRARKADWGDAWDV